MPQRIYTFGTFPQSCTGSDCRVWYAMTLFKCLNCQAEVHLSFIYTRFLYYFRSVTSGLRHPFPLTSAGGHVAIFVVGHVDPGASKRSWALQTTRDTPKIVQKASINEIELGRSKQDWIVSKLSVISKRFGATDRNLTISQFYSQHLPWHFRRDFYDCLHTNLEKQTLLDA